MSRNRTGSCCSDSSTPIRQWSCTPTVWRKADIRHKQFFSPGNYRAEVVSRRSVEPMGAKFSSCEWREDITRCNHSRHDLEELDQSCVSQWHSTCRIHRAIVQNVGSWIIGQSTSIKPTPITIHSETVKFERRVSLNVTIVLLIQNFYTKYLIQPRKKWDDISQNKSEAVLILPFSTGFSLIATLRSCHVSDEDSSLLVLPLLIIQSSLITWNDPPNYLVSTW